MGLLAKEKALIQTDYFKVWDIVELLSKDGFNSWEEIGQFLGHYDADTELTLYKQDPYCRINEVHNNYLPIRKLIDGLNMVWLEGEDSIQALKLDLIDYYWSKHEIYNFKPIIDLGIIEKPLTQLITIPSIQEAQLNKYKFFLYKQPLFTINECACIASEYDPLEIQKFSVNDIDEIVPDYSMAYNLINSAIEAGILPCFNSKVNSEDLKEYLANQNIEIKEFNEDEYIHFHTKNSLKEQAKFASRTPALHNSNTETNSLENKMAELEKTISLKNNEIAELSIDLKATENSLNKLEAIVQKKDAEIEKLKKDVQKENGDVFILCMDLDKTKHDLEQLKLKNEQLESNLLIKNDLQPNNLLDLIFDETAQERYAPDLVSAIKLWEHLYITAPKNAKHGNKANYWIKQNTPYTDISSVEIKRLREVTSPFDSWHIDRKNKFNK